MMVSCTGKRNWYWRYAWRGEKQVIRIGEFPGICVEEARRIAREYGAMLDQGIDPKGEQKARKAMPTLEEFAWEQYMPYARQHKRSADDDESKLKMWVLPKLGRKLLCDITRQDVDMYRTAIKGSHTASTANRHHALIARMLSLAVEWDLLKVNPVTGLKKFREASDAGRFLTPEEIGRLLAALDQEENVVAAAALKVLLLTGCRREEIAQARWEHLDAERELLKLPKTKAGKVRWVPLNEQAQAVLVGLPNIDGPWVFPGRDPSQPIHNLYKPFKRALKAAGLDESIRIHDLRHSFASNAVTAGVSLFQVQTLLGHSSSQMTQRYAHLAGSALHDASAVAAKAMLVAAQQQKA
ncbi:site-specific integrase [Caldimonas tepidiphila]|uniref:site-specific integrase n=1 Tax=Caldimonas tepidiphila TaxID=2315841 RepID=UPI000E5BDB8A|nr:site-specific integrase [Caldimonas tepidiphila]